MDELSKICVTCGLCCDGSLFNRAILFDKSRDIEIVKKEGLGEVIHDGEQSYMSQPCPKFKDCCSIYNKEKPKVCSTYYCQPLTDLSNGKITFDDAKKIVQQALETRKEILSIASQIDDYKNFSFGDLQKELSPLPSEKIKKYIELFKKLISFQGVKIKLDKSFLKKHP